MDPTDSNEVFEELKNSTTAKKYMEIIEALINDFDKDEVIQVFRTLLLDHEICTRVVGSGESIESFYDQIIGIIKSTKLSSSKN